jgi:hypothetical protein
MNSTMDGGMARPVDAKSDNPTSLPPPIIHGGVEL